MRRKRVPGRDHEAARLTAVFVLVFGSLAVLIAGVVMLLVGYAERRVEGQTYEVAFVLGTGADCDGAHGLYLRVTDGEPLFCQPAPVVGGAVDLPGFSDEQVSDVTGLAKRLALVGQPGLSADDQRAIQGRVDSILATVPPADRQDGDSWIAGAPRLWIGLAMATLGLLGLFGWWRLTKGGWI